MARTEWKCPNGDGGELDYNVDRDEYTCPRCGLILTQALLDTLVKKIPERTDNKTKTEGKEMAAKIGKCNICGIVKKLPVMGRCSNCEHIVHEKCGHDIEKAKEYVKNKPPRGSGKSKSSGPAGKQKRAYHRHNEKHEITGPVVRSSHSIKSGQLFLDELLAEREELDALIEQVKKRVA